MLRLVAIFSATLAFCFPSTSVSPEKYVPPTTTTLVPQVIMAKWYNVAWCETHGQWHRNEPVSDGGLGISRTNWAAYGGLSFAPAPHLATPEQQVYIAQVIQARNYVAGYVPDQDGNCRAW